MRRLVHEVLFPPVCVLCDTHGERLDLCSECHADLPKTKSVCPRCGLPLPIATLCGHCLQFPPSYDRMVAAFSYAPPVDHLIIALKFHKRLAYAQLLGELLADHLDNRQEPLPELIIPVPLHPTRLRERGYNQSLELARPIARRLGVPIAPYSLCQRIRATVAQSSLNANMRKDNVKNAFSVTTQISECRVTILDDVVTTGNTVEEIARVLRVAGAQEIEVWTVARTLR